ncbi:hypothetical protein D3227_38855 [Mesorhizobium waimense]|uniref:Uncharacterized protein n=1 Tax=Mesorhizobium waimense TaxID=1300307 RepID=A0A3A5JYS1_9HYPH|nr:hypothetical protein [Mesorhizobium waimense]RJT23423.1 hypothetical protein D3227_38855 [Mesorhizobium waimense]
MQLKDFPLAPGNGAFFCDYQAASPFSPTENRMIYGAIIPPGFTVIRIWLKDRGIAIPEITYIAKRGAETFCDLSRRLFIQ